MPWSILLLLPLAACGGYRPSASAVSASKEAAARSSSLVPLVSYGLEIESPELRPQIPWLELRGRAGTAELFEADLVIALDTSLNMLLPSGMDLDGDGVIGAMRGAVQAGRGGSSLIQGADIDAAGAVVHSNIDLALHPRNWTTDRDDTVAQLEIEAARRLILGLGPRRNRIGVVSYTDRGRTRAAVGEPADALVALEAMRLTGETPAKNVASGLRQARLLFSKLDDHSPTRQRAVLLFTDGRPTHPPDEHIARLQSLREAETLAQRGIALYVLAVGHIDVAGARYLLELAGTGQGRAYRVWDPGRVLEDLPPLALAPRWLDIVNATTATSARALRAGPDGRFDAFVPLAPGTNRIRVIAELGDGRLQRWEKDVSYQPPAVETEAHQRANEVVLREIEARAAESVRVPEVPLAPEPAAGSETPLAP